MLDGSNRRREDRESEIRLLFECGRPLRSTMVQLLDQSGFVDKLAAAHNSKEFEDVFEGMMDHERLAVASLLFLAIGEVLLEAEAENDNRSTAR